MSQDKLGDLFAVIKCYSGIKDSTSNEIIYLKVFRL